MESHSATEEINTQHNRDAPLVPVRRSSFAHAREVITAASTVSLELHASDDSESAFKNSREFLVFLLSTTVHWVIFPVFFMFAGTTIIHSILLPHIYVCPDGATCPHSLDPRGQVLKVIQTAMEYWFQFGSMIASVGVFKVVAYNGWLLTRKRESTIETLENDLAVAHGSTFEAFSLVWKRRNVMQGLLVLAQVAIAAVIPLVVNRSISTTQATVRLAQVQFDYPKYFIPSMVGQPRDKSFTGFVAEGLNWFWGNNDTYPVDRFHGTFTVRDNRTLHAVGAQPDGSRIGGTVSCSGDGLSSVVLPNQTPTQATTFYNVSYGTEWAAIPSNVNLTVFFVAPSVRSTVMITGDNTTVYLRMVWASSVPGTIVNGTTTDDGRLHIAQCVHTIETHPVENQYPDRIRSTMLYRTPNLSLYCPGQSDDICTRVAVGYAAFSWWKGPTSRLTNGEWLAGEMGCRRGVMSYVGAGANETCVPDDATWSAFLAMNTEALVQGSKKIGVATQTLTVAAQSVSRSRWWLQVIIPIATVLLYTACVAHAFHINPGKESLRQLTVSEIVVAIFGKKARDLALRRGESVDSATNEGSPIGMGRVASDCVRNIPRSDEPREHSTRQQPGSAWDRESPLEKTPITPRVYQKLLLFYIRTTGHWVAGGFILMLAGIIAVRFTLLTHIHTCPGGADCRGSYDPHGDTPREIQTLMSYCLLAGTLLAGIGIVKVVAYHGWITMTKNGTAIEILELKLAAIHGNTKHALQLIWKSRSRSVTALIIFAQVGIAALIPLVVNRSISHLTRTGHSRVSFTYPEQASLDTVVTAVDDILPAIFLRQESWIAGNNQTYPIDRFTGSFVWRDNRTVYAVDAQPSGSRVTGTVSCSADNISSAVIPSPYLNNATVYNITVGNQWGIPSSVFLAMAFLGDPAPLISDDNSTMSLRILWVSNTTGMITNGTTTSDGILHIALCLHTIDLTPIPDEGPESIQPTKLSFPTSISEYCTGEGRDELCLKLILANILIITWAGERRSAVGNQIIGSRIFCQRGILERTGEAKPEECRPDSQSWTATLAAFTDNLVQSSRPSRTATQQLLIHNQAIDRSRWWVLVFIPLAMLVLYVVSISLLLNLDRRTELPKQLNLSEIISAVTTAQADDILDHVKCGESVGSVVVGEQLESSIPVVDRPNGQGVEP